MPPSKDSRHQNHKRQKYTKQKIMDEINNFREKARDYISKWKLLQKESKKILRFMTLVGPYLYRCKELSAHYITRPRGWTKV